MACGLWLKQPGVYLLAFLASRRLKALGFGSGLLHVLAVLGLAKMLRALAVVNLAISIYPNLTRCSSSGGGSGSFGGGGGGFSGGGFGGGGGGRW